MVSYGHHVHLQFPNICSTMCAMWNVHSPTQARAPATHRHNRNNIKKKWNNGTESPIGFIMKIPNRISLKTVELGVNKYVYTVRLKSIVRTVQFLSYNRTYAYQILYEDFGRAISIDSLGHFQWIARNLYFMCVSGKSIRFGSETMNAFNTQITRKNCV